MFDDFHFEDKFHPWDVKSLEEFRFYCCPECPSKHVNKTDFIKHAVTEHQSIIEVLDVVNREVHHHPVEKDHQMTKKAVMSSKKSRPSRPRSPSPEPLRKKAKNAASNRIESDDEDEYDSEMDDFIDDSDTKMDVSAEIAKMFGYNRHKYRDEDFDDRDMENNRFSDIMKEEARSARIGRMEDLEDIRREEEENRRKKMRKQRNR